MNRAIVLLVVVKLRLQHSSQGHLSFRCTKVIPRDLINVCADHSLEIDSLSWKAQLDVSGEKHTWEPCSVQEKVNVHMQQGYNQRIIES